MSFHTKPDQRPMPKCLCKDPCLWHDPEGYALKHDVVNVHEDLEGAWQQLLQRMGLAGHVLT